MEPKKKKKKNNGIDDNMETNGNLPNGVIDKLHVENKEKKSKSEFKKSKSDADDDVKSPVKSEKKKKKSKAVSDSLGEDDVEIVPETIQEAASTADPVIEPGKLSKKPKDKKGKNKSISDPQNAPQDRPGSSQEVINKKPKDLQGPEHVAETAPVENPLDDTAKKPKDKKKKKKDESLLSGCRHVGDLNGTDTKKEDVLASTEYVMAVEKKSSKKRKRPAPEELDSNADDDIASKELDPNKIDASNEKNENEQLEESRKAKEKPSAGVSKKEVDGLANGNAGKNGKDITPQTTKKDLGSSTEVCAL